MVETRVLAAGMTGAAIGAAQTPLLRQYLDPRYPNGLISALGGFGSPSALVGIVAGGISLAYGLIGKGRKNGTQRYSDSAVEAATDYGTAALISGVLSGVFPATPSISTVSMRAPRVQRAVRPYTQNMDAISKMSSELQRLSHENSALRSRLMQDDSDRINGGPIAPGSVPSTVELPAFSIPPGSPTPRATEFGFMQNNEEEEEGERFVPESVLRENSDVPGPLAPEHMQPSPGQPTKKATRFGFMQGIPTNPISKVQSMKGRFDFLG